MKLKDISNNSPKKFLNKVYLLEVEIVAVADTKKAEVNNKLTILLPQEYILNNKETILYERVWIFFVNINKLDSGLKYSSKSLRYYNT